MNEIDPKRELLVNLTCFYRPPNHLEADEQAKRYLAELADAFGRMQPNAFEWDHVWNEFKREWTKAYWPTFSEFPQRLMKFRTLQASVRKASGEQQHDRAHPSHQLPHRPYNHAEFMGAVAQASAAEAERHPVWHGLDAAVVAMGEQLIIERDDDDELRPLADRAAAKARVEASRRTAA